MNNHIVLDLKKVQHGTFFYKNQYGNVRRTLPKSPTVHGDTFDVDALHAERTMTMFEYAKKYLLLDVWLPVCRFRLAANHDITYTGDKAVSMWKAFREKIFRKAK